MIKKPLSKEILFGRLVNGGIVEVGANGNDLTLTYPEILPVVENVEIDKATEDQ